MPIDRGCVYNKTIQFKTRTDGQPIDVTTWQLDASLKNAAGTEVLAMSTSGGHFTATEPLLGKIRISLTEAETTALAAGPVSFVIHRTDGDRSRLGKATELVRDAE